MLDRCMSIQECDFLHFGSYEQKALRKMRGKMTKSYQIFIDGVLNNCINILSVISRHVYFPTYSNGLKDIAKYLGCAWTDPNASGIQTVVWREQWQRSGDDHWKQKIVDYNLEDCWALKKVTEFIEQIVTTKNLPERPSDMPWTYTESLARHTHSRLIFENQQFADPDFDKINRCAYFDYQRNKVAARKSKNSRLKSRYSKKHTGALIKPNKIIKLALQRCPCCRSRNINLTGEKSKQITDIKFSRQVVKRWIVRYTTCVYKCAECGEVCKGERIPVYKSKFGTGLIAWCIYHNLVSGQNIMRIKQGLEDLFGLDVPQPSIYRFKQTFAQQCTSHYNGIFERLLRSQFLYIDETPVNLRATKGYVWVMANEDSAYFFYRDSREGSFLADMLKSFNGVLISDFYTAYDSLNVKQQRCLIHLMRDFNEELLKNPFDGDLKEMTRHFSSVLTGIVDTIDRYGLKKRHLGKHKVPATRFLEWAIHSEFHSEVAKKFQDRIGKYKKMLFTFLDYDGISWNNNNAEHAIKSFARYRQFADGRFTKLSIKNYLVLLSVYQTCEYREENFLDFLLGDINAISF
jgi:hypothetical protein